ncbi:MAG TPA: hypothetical protein VMT91_06840, partial [Anaerolineales bacterium]|nr:hypothetical protein [Anaerolineales bacterium]
PLARSPFIPQSSISNQQSKISSPQPFVPLRSAEQITLSPPQIFRHSARFTANPPDMVAKIFVPLSFFSNNESHPAP